jgi:hypothetical protein
MEKINKCLLFLFFAIFFSPFFSHSQEQEIIRKGLLRAQLTYSPSYMFADKNTYFYLHGNIEAYLTNTISVSGEGFYFLGKQSAKDSDIAFNHTLFYGFNKHFVKGNNDFYVGIQPGFSIMKLNPPIFAWQSPKVGVNPVFSAIVGYNFYINKVFHFFLQSRIVAGENHTYQYKNITEFRFSAGLGFNLNALK